MLRYALISLLQTYDYDVRPFADASKYLDSAERDTIDLVVTDIQMPGVSGFDLQRELHARSDRTPVIMITALPQPDIVQRALAVGAKACLLKPFDGSSLITAIETALSDPEFERT